MSTGTCVSVCVCVGVCVCVCKCSPGVGAGQERPARGGEGVGQLAFVHGARAGVVSPRCVAFPLCLCLCVSPQTCSVLRLKTAGYKGSGPVAWAMEQDGKLVRVERGSFSPPHYPVPLPPHDPLGIFRSLS